jgi:tetratricopeptide (TPR) repeat protein
MQMANFYIDDGKPNRAINALSDILNKNPNQYDVYLCKARVYERIGKSDKALEDLREIPKTLVVLRLDVFKLRGRIYSKMGKYSEAIAAYEEVVDIEPIADNLARVGLLYIKMKNYRSALGWYEQATDMEPNNSKFIYNLGCCYEALRDKKKALECYEKSIQIDSDAKETQIALARIKGLPIPVFKNANVNTKSKNKVVPSDGKQEPPKAS